MRRNPSGFAPVNLLQIFCHILQILFAQREVIADPSHIHTAVYPDHPGLSMEKKLFFHYLFHHLRDTAKTTDFMQNKKLMLQLRSSFQGSWRKIILFTKHDLCFGKTCSFPHVWIFQNTSLFVSLFSICKCFQWLKVKFVDLLWPLNILHAPKLYNYDVFPFFYFSFIAL